MNPRLERIRRRLREFAGEHGADLPLYRAICLGAAQDDEVASLLLAARPGQARPVLLLAALHDLVLRDPTLPAARWYPSVVGRDGVPAGDPWPEVRTTLLGNREHLERVIATRDTQTNEVNRAITLAVLLDLANADVQGPIWLLELGASAGLLLGFDRYRLQIDDVVLGETGSPVRCFGENRSQPPLVPQLPEVVARIGLDRNPIRMDDAESLRWLEACLWPDVPGRVERYEAAVSLLRADPPVVLEGDMVDDVGAAITRLAPRGHLVVFSSWAVTYLEPARRGLIADHLSQFHADTGFPVSWVAAEPDGCIPDVPPLGLEGGTVLSGRRWRSGRELQPQVWGQAHPHGAWVCVGPGRTVTQPR